MDASSWTGTSETCPAPTTEVLQINLESLISQFPGAFDSSPTVLSTLRLKAPKGHGQDKHLGLMQADLVGRLHGMATASRSW